MRALLFTVLVSFNLVACVTGDNAEDMDMPVGEITAAPQDDMVEQDVADEDAQLRPNRELPSTGGAQLEKAARVPGTNGPSLQQDGQLPKIVEDTALETLSDEELEQLEQDHLHGKQIDANLPVLR
ncbi:MAG: hypothetical protein M4D80_02455 [Myxococcota bacterium]|nr:hypothetical protein [Myxococcota bacterium]